VQARHDDDGISTLIARMATEQALAVAAEVDRLAHDPRLQLRDDTGADAIGVRRSEALAALVLAGAGSGATGTPAGATSSATNATPATAAVNLVMDLPTWLGLRDAPVATIEGLGIPAAVARRLAMAATVRRLITDPITGALLDYGRRTYEVPTALRQFLTARDAVCRFPGCRRRAGRCQIDHAVPWNRGGSTNPANTGPLCTRHHQQKTHGGWDITESRPDGSCTWRSPLGRRYDVEPAITLEQPALPPLLESRSPRGDPSPDDGVPPF
jgi:hypothetical protein